MSVYDKIKVFLCNNASNTPLPLLAEVPTKWFSYLPYNIPSPPLFYQYLFLKIRIGKLLWLITLR